MRALAAAALVWSVGCGGPTRVRIVGPEGPADVTVPSLLHLDSVAGEVGELFGGARIDFGRTDDLRDRGQNREAMVTHPTAVRARYVVNGDEVAVATDFDTLMLFSAYANLERAAFAFHSLGVPGTGLPVPVYYAPVIVDGSLPSTDAAAYVAGADLFVFESSGDLPGLPLAANPGVVAHEYSHRVWYYELWAGALLERLPVILDDPAQTAGYNLLRAVDEGVADYFGAVVAGDPRYLARSFDGLDHRMLDSHFALDASWLDGEAPRLLGRYDPYAAGMVLASTLWRIRTESLDAAIVATQRELSSRLGVPLSYALGDFESELLRHLDSAARVDACHEFEESYAVAWERFASVCQ